MDDARWLEQAWREFGEAERAGASSNPRIMAMFRDAGRPDVTRDEVAWCAAFVGACLERAGLRSTRSLLARSYLKWGDALPKPCIGAIAVFSRGSDPSQGHVGFWLGETDEAIVVLGGNQSNAVSVALYPKSRLLAVRWPAAAQTAVQPSVQSGNAAFERALAHVLEMEGGYTDDPHDPGGPTNRGITLAVFAAWKRLKLSDANRAALIRDLKEIDPATVREIYRKRYWNTGHCAELPPALAFMHFDAAVNHGFGTAIRCLQEAVGADADGEIGPETRAAVARTPLNTALANYASIRKRRYRALPHFWRFGRGWLRRVETTLERARVLLTETVPQTPLPTEGDTDMTAIQSNPKWWGHSVTIWGTIVTILSTVVPALAPVTGIDVSGDLVQNAGEQVVDTVQTVGTLIGTLMTIYGRLRATKPIALGLFKVR
ncbi:TIGR02594 family protein [Hyphomicrobium sp.]|uniref:TIGR02594 family protein n=1 Tax=Hyphomicrobium sp. TaxID=82 RepID=UPI002E321D35|nr:TIGR02594 family protein [Hyphomicrobium sp.]HEX2843307.1 TIGR02594 family protein [Hyphomicrobium sp.]